MREDRTRAPALPVAELTHPAALAAMALLAVNDHLLKGAGILPGWLTGKLSDVAGVVFFPLLLTALLDTALWIANRVAAALGRPPRLDTALTVPKVVAACAVTAFALAAIQLSDTAVAAYRAFTGAFGFPAHVTQDPTDILALAFLAVPLWIGVRAARTARTPRSAPDATTPAAPDAGRPAPAGWNGIASN